MFQKVQEANSIDCNLSSSIGIQYVYILIYLFISINNNIFTLNEAYLGNNEIQENREQYMGITCIYL